MKKIFSNIVEEKEMREVQSRTLEILKEALTKSFGPFGKNTAISKVSGQTLGPVVYTKDGHTILKNITFQDIIESSVKESIEDITRNIVIKVGDGTTSAVLLSSIIFDKLKELESEKTPYEIARDFKDAVKIITDEILKNRKEFTPEVAYDISYISTNGNDDVANTVKHIYEKYGTDVYIDLTTSPSEEHYLKSYDGMTLDSGYSESAFVNTNEGKSRLQNARIYAFDDPIDTPQMGGYLDAIISTNILNPFSKGEFENAIPTVIIAPKISSDFSAYMKKITEVMYNTSNVLQRPPLLIITNIHQYDVYSDICHLCGCKTIKKYLDPKQYDNDVSIGLAPTKDTIVDFYGEAELVESDSVKTKFINPKLMHKDGTMEYSSTFENLVSFLETELKTLQEQSSRDSHKVYNLKRRIQALKANLVEYYVGGLSPSDRDNLRDLVEDAIKNCKSASEHGYGYGSNFEGLRASYKLLNTNKDDEMIALIYNAYREIVGELYTVSGINNVESTIDMTLQEDINMPFDIRNKKLSDRVLASIQSDIVILDAISRIITMMITTNQFLCPDFMYNKYMNK